MHHKTAWWGLDGAPDTHGSVYHEDDNPGLDAYPLLVDTSNAARHKVVEALKEESTDVAGSHIAAAPVHVGDDCEVSSEQSAHDAAADEPTSSDVDMDSSDDDGDGQVADSKIAVRQALKRQQEEEERRIAAMYPKRPRLWDPDRQAREKAEAERQQRLHEQEEEQEQERQEVLRRSYASHKRRRMCGAESSQESLGSTEHHLRTGRSIWRQW